MVGYEVCICVYQYWIAIRYGVVDIDASIVQQGVFFDIINWRSEIRITADELGQLYNIAVDLEFLPTQVDVPASTTVQPCASLFCRRLRLASLLFLDLASNSFGETSQILLPK